MNIKIISIAHSVKQLYSIFVIIIDEGNKHHFSNIQPDTRLKHQEEVSLVL